MDFSYSSLLSDVGYRPVDIVNKKISDSILDAFGELGGSISSALMYQLLQVTGLSYGQLLANYDAVEQALRHLLGKGADIMISMIKVKLMQYSRTDDPSLSIKQIIDKIRESESLDFISGRAGHEHFVLLYSNEKSKEKMLKRFFDPSIAGDAPKGIVYSRPQTEGDAQSTSVHYQPYSAFFNPDEKEKSAEKIAGWISDLHSQNKTANYPSRFAGDEDTWCLENGFSEEILSLEENIGRNIKDNMLVLCTYNLTKIENKPEFIRRVIASHKYIIFDEPFSVYERNEDDGK